MLYLLLICLILAVYYSIRLYQQKKAARFVGYWRDGYWKKHFYSPLTSYCYVYFYRDGDVVKQCHSWNKPIMGERTYPFSAEDNVPEEPSGLDLYSLDCPGLDVRHDLTPQGTVRTETYVYVSRGGKSYTEGCYQRKLRWSLILCGIFSFSWIFQNFILPYIILMFV